MKGKLVVLFVYNLMFNFCIGQNSMLVQSLEPPIIPIGEDAYLQWDKMPYHRIGVRGYMRSTYDRFGNNHWADASNYLYQENDSFNVTLDIKSPGIIYFIRTNHWHGSPWHYEVDGKDFIVKETATENPVGAKKSLSHTTFIPERQFPNPLAWTWSQTKGANLNWVPMAFEKSFRLAYSRTFYGTGYYIYHRLTPGIKHISKPLESWAGKAPNKKVLNLLSKAGSDIAPKGKDATTYRGKLSLKPNKWATVLELNQAPSTIRAIKFTIPREKAYDFGKSRLRITWDHGLHSSIDVPLDLFFGAGHLYNPKGKEYLVKGLPMVIRYDEENVYLSCYYPMPFFKYAKIEIQDCEGKHMDNISWEIRTVPYDGPANHVTYFHATYSDHPEPIRGRDITFLDTDRIEGGGMWSGNFVGMSWVFSKEGKLGTLEGDPRFFFDNSNTPQGWGTGTEEWGGGGDYWGGDQMTLPLAGHPVGEESKNAKREKDLINSAYRFLIADLFPFGNRAIINLEHGGVNESNEHYSGVVYWYGVNAASLIITDELNVSNKTSIQEHKYLSPTSSKPYSLTSRYELGPDGHYPRPRYRETNIQDSISVSQHYFPAEEDLVRTMKGTSQFIVNLDSANLGVMLRRKFDYGYPNQNAKIFVKQDGTESDWNYVGSWYTAGSNTFVHSFPREELGKTKHQVFTSNRRWREEEFLIPRHLTEGIKKLAVKIEFVPNDKELYPGYPFPIKSAWSESRYWVYCYKMPILSLN